MTSTNLTRMAATGAVSVPGSGTLRRLPSTQDHSPWGSVRGLARRGFFVILAFVGTFFAWASLAPLDGGAVAPGIVSPDGNKRTVQHLEGGIIAKLLVRDGDIVRSGQTLLVLESIQPKSVYDTLRQESRTLSIMRARLVAEKLDKPGFELPAEIVGRSDPETQHIIDDQWHLFMSRHKMHQSRQSVLRQRVGQLDEQIRGLEAQVSSADRQLVLIADEIKSKRFLLGKDLIAKPEVLKLERVTAEIEGRRGEQSANIAKAKQQIGETRLQLLALEAERSEQIAVQLDDVRRRLVEIDQRMDASRDVLQRTTITSPADGVVLNMKFKTEGGVVTKGEPILDIVPSNDVLLIDARVHPTDIDIVKAGLPAFVHLTAYSNRIVPKVDGIVKMVSADRLVDEASKQPYFLARVEVARKDIDRIEPKVELVSGMPAEVLIVTERRTLFDYLMQPVLDVWRRSFREA